MAVSAEVRRVEREIDRWMTSHPYLRSTASGGLRALLLHHCEETANAMGTLRRALVTRNPGLLEVGLRREDTLRVGAFWALKWVLRVAGNNGTKQPRRSAAAEFFEECGAYSVLCDGLAIAEQGGGGVVYSPSERLLTFYEGGERTGSDATMIGYQAIANATSLRTVLTSDADQLTSEWTAGQYRRCVAALAKDAARQARATALARRGALDVAENLVVSVAPSMLADHSAVLAAMTVTESDARDDRTFFMLRDWMDTPLVKTDCGVLGVSGMLTSLAGGVGEEHMLRLAAMRDPQQYSLVSGKREERMTSRCLEVFRGTGWQRVDVPSSAAGDIDLYVKRGRVSVGLQLKSLLRPHAPTEVFRRNRDLVKGIDQVKRARAWLPSAAIGMVVTDGYRGDYAVWGRALDARVPIATLDDLSDVARTPSSSMALLKRRAGISGRVADPLAPRRCALGAWTLEFRDEPPPDPD